MEHSFMTFKRWHWTGAAAGARTDADVEAEAALRAAMKRAAKAARESLEARGLLESELKAQAMVKARTGRAA